MLIDWDKFISWIGTPLSQIAFWFQWYKALVQPVAQLYVDFQAFVNISLVNISQNGMKIVLVFNLNKLYTTNGTGITIARGGIQDGVFVAPMQSVDPNANRVWLNSSATGRTTYSKNVFLKSSAYFQNAFDFTVFISNATYVPTSDSNLKAYINTFIPTGKTFIIIHTT